MQKRPLLYDLKELYSAFKLQDPNIKIGFFKFCSLRAKWCILVGHSGGYVFCVCLQNPLECGANAKCLQA